MLTSPSMLLFRRMALLLKSENFGVENISTGFRRGQTLFIQYLKPRKMSRVLKETHMELVSDSASHKDIGKFLDGGILMFRKGTVQWL